MAQKQRPGDMTAEQAIAHYSERTPDGCLRWTRYVTESGAPLIRFGGRRQDVRRLAWENVFGPVETGTRFGHSCHDIAAVRGECDGGPECPHRRCVDPTHLRLPIAQQEASEPADPESAAGIGRAIRLARIAQDMTQAELGALTGILRGRIIDVECHRLRRLSAHKIFEITEELGLDIGLDAIKLAKWQAKQQARADALKQG